MIKKSTREPLARNEPIRKKKPAPPPAEAKKVLSREPLRTAVPLKENSNVRVFRPEEATPVQLPPDAVGPRKLIRTTMEDVRRRQAEGKLKLNEAATSSAVRGQHAAGMTNEEFQYLSELAKSRTRVTVKMNNGETAEGYIEYSDKNFIRLTRKGKPNLFIYKHDIKYLVEGNGGRSGGGEEA